MVQPWASGRTGTRGDAWERGNSAARRPPYARCPDLVLLMGHWAGCRVTRRVVTSLSTRGCLDVEPTPNGTPLQVAWA
jgi:hypothetical protein